jgi:hypothetical protein
MSYAIEAIASKTNIDKEELEKAVFNVKKVTVDKASQEVFDKIKAQSEKLGGEKGIIEILSAIHDGWVKDNVKKFNQEGEKQDVINIFQSNLSDGKRRKQTCYS